MNRLIILWTVCIVSLSSTMTISYTKKRIDRLESIVNIYDAAEREQQERFAESIKKQLDQLSDIIDMRMYLNNETMRQEIFYQQELIDALEELCEEEY